MILLKKNNLKLLIVAYFITFIFFLYQLVGYDYFDARLLIVLFTDLIIEFFVMLYYNDTQKIFSHGIIFNAFALFYSSYYFYAVISNSQPVQDNSYFTIFLTLISIISFNIAYRFSGKMSDSRKFFTEYNYKTVRTMSFFLMLISYAAEFYVVFRKIGLGVILNATRAEVSLAMESFGLLSFYRYTFPLLSSIFLLTYLKHHKKMDAVCFAICFVMSIFNAVLYVSRANMIAVLLPIAYLLERYYILNKRQLIVLSFVIFILFGFWKGLYSNKMVLSFNSEFSTWYRIFDNIKSDNGYAPQFGKSYLITLLNLFVPVTNTESLSKWYVRTYEYSTYLRGGGRGFSEIVEAYLNFGVVGNIIVFYIYGIIFKQIKDDDDFHTILYIIFMLSIYQIFRSDSYSMWKNMMWFRVYPTILIFLLAKIGYKEKRNIEVNLS